MIECIHISKHYGTKKVLNDISCSISDGEFICFSGESGKGKTTLLNIIGMIERPTSGRILFDGKEIRSNKDRLSFFQKKVGFVFQNFALVEGKTVKQNLNLVQMGSRNNITFEEALSHVGLSDRLNDKVYMLSGGEQQRVALARLFIKQCSIILADEPTGSLDKRNATIVLEILRRLNEQGKTIIIATHDQEIKLQCDRIIEL